jgi:hypothetical protein
MACIFEPDDERFDEEEKAMCPAWVTEAMGAVPIEGGPPRLFLGEVEGVELWGIVDFFERERLTDEAEREATERYRASELEEAA